jgi:hypothetical protein
MIEQQEKLPQKLTVADIYCKIKMSEYTLLGDGRTTVCQLTLENGFTVIGTSACVSKEQYNQALGEKFAYEKAFEEIWQLEGYLLRQRRFEAGLE